MRLGLRARIALAALAASGAALVAVLVLVGPGLRRRALEHSAGRLIAEARLMAHLVEEPLTHEARSEDVDRVVDEAARLVEARVTIIDLGGRVIADSEVSGPELARLENHSGRPEVRDVLSGSSGTSVRHSATVDRDLLYAAVPIRSGGRLIGVSRLALSLEGIEEQARDLRRSVAAALALAFLVTAVLAFPLARPLLGPLQAVMDSARRFAAGDLTARARVARFDEIGELARILDRSADQLQARLTDLARERARTESVIASMRSGLLAVDHAGLVLLANPSLRRALGLREPIGRHYVEVIRHPELGQIVEEVLRTGKPRTGEIQLARLGGDYEVTATPFPGLEGQPHGAVATFENVTERRRLDEIRRDFVANASHELRTPLTSIRGFVEALEDEGALGDPAVARRFLQKIHANADRMSALVSDLLELSRLETGYRAPLYERLLARELVDEVIGSLADLARTKGIELRGDCQAVERVEADPDHLRRILENLVDNAVKYTPPGGHVLVAVRPGEGGVVFEVTDDGPGIEPRHRSRIFERFYRVDKARSRELGGTGLGLSIVRHLAEAMGGSASVESEPGRGSRFRVRLPQPPAPDPVRGTGSSAARE